MKWLCQFYPKFSRMTSTQIYFRLTLGDSIYFSNHIFINFDQALMIFCRSDQRWSTFRIILSRLWRCSGITDPTTTGGMNTQAHGLRSATEPTLSIVNKQLSSVWGRTYLKSMWKNKIREKVYRFYLIVVIGDCIVFLVLLIEQIG